MARSVTANPTEPASASTTSKPKKKKPSKKKTTKKTTKKKPAKKKPAEKPEPQPTESTSTPGLKDLGTLSLRSKLFVNALPSHSQAVLVNYLNSEYSYRISCVIPPAKRRVSIEEDYYDDYDYEEDRPSGIIEIESPALIFTGEYRDLDHRNVYPTFYMFTYDPTAIDCIRVKPCCISNVYADGRVCTGGYTPYSLRQGYNIFWSTPFNEELSNSPTEVARRHGLHYSEKDLMDHIVGFNEWLKLIPWENRTQFICGKDYWAAPKGAAGILVSKKKELLNKIPEEFHSIDMHNEHIIIALAHRQDNGLWTFESGSYRFSLKEEKIKLINS